MRAFLFSKIQIQVIIKNMKKNFESIISDLNKQETNNLYRLALKIQMDLTKSEVLNFLKSIKTWTQGQTILDIGCGPGDLIKVLNSEFPLKNYIGVDFNDDFIQIANNQVCKNNIQFFTEDIYKYSPKTKFDFVHARAVLQHLPSIPDLLKKLEEITTENGSVLFFDAGDINKIKAPFTPEIPSYKTFLKKISLAQKEGGGNRDCLQELELLIPSSNFRSVSSKEIYSSTQENINKEDAVTYIYLVIEVLDRLYKTDFDKDQFIHELKRWYDSDKSEARFHGKWLLIQKVDHGSI